MAMCFAKQKKNLVYCLFSLLRLSLSLFVVLPLLHTNPHFVLFMKMKTYIRLKKTIMF